jgi:hypothetical protein
LSLTLLFFREAEVYPSYMAGFVTIMGYMITGLVALNPILSWLFLKLGLLPSPGEGPSEERMNHGFLKVTTIGTGSNGGKVHVMFYFPTDPGYRDTVSSYMLPSLFNQLIIIFIIIIIIIIIIILLYYL